MAALRQLVMDKRAMDLEQLQVISHPDLSGISRQPARHSPQLFSSFVRKAPLDLRSIRNQTISRSVDERQEPDHE